MREGAQATVIRQLMVGRRRVRKALSRAAWRKHRTTPGWLNEPALAVEVVVVAILGLDMPKWSSQDVVASDADRPIVRTRHCDEGTAHTTACGAEQQL